jgi:hypothetical protein
MLFQLQRSAALGSEPNRAYDCPMRSAQASSCRPGRRGIKFDRITSIFDRNRQATTYV